MIKICKTNKFEYNASIFIKFNHFNSCCGEILSHIVISNHPAPYSLCVYITNFQNRKQKKNLLNKTASQKKGEEENIGRSQDLTTTAI